MAIESSSEPVKGAAAFFLAGRAGMEVAVGVYVQEPVGGPAAAEAPLVVAVVRDHGPVVVGRGEVECFIKIV